jgi:hypothetical protein
VQDAADIARLGAARSDARPWRVWDQRGHAIELLGELERMIRFFGESYRARPDFSPETPRPTRTFTVWLSDDADRVPLKVAAKTELGDVVMNLTEYNRNAAPAE